VTRDEALTRIRFRLGNRSASYLPTELIAEIKYAQIQLEDMLLKTPPWFLLTEFATEETAVGEERVPEPTNFLAEYEDGVLYRFDASATDPWIELGKGFFDAEKAFYTTAGAPVKYSKVGTYFVLHPTPDLVYTLKMKYYKRDTVLNTNIENQWLKYAPNILIARTGLNVSESVKDRDSARFFAGLYAESERALATRIAQLRVVNLPLVRSDI
jgi:hypothetical protein